MKSVRIAGGLGFYGDSWKPIKASIERGNVRYVASDHLAELTLAILQKDRQRDPTLGYNSLHGTLADSTHANDLNEVYLRIAVRCADKKEAAKLGRLFPPLALSGPPFIGGAAGMLEPRGLLGIWPTLAPRSIIEEYVRVSVEES